MAGDVFLIALSSRGLGRKWRVGSTCLLGRHPECDIQIVDAQVSKRHARILRTPSGFRVEDLGSRNGVVVNGVPVSSEAPLAANDVLCLGDQAFLFAPSFDVLPEAEGRAVLLVDDEAATQASTGQREALPDHASSFLLAALAQLSREQAPEAILPELLRLLSRRIPFDGAAVLVKSDANDVLETVCLLSGNNTLSVSRTIVQEAERERCALLVGDAASDIYLAQGRSVQRGQVRAVLVAPLFVQDVCVGLVYLCRDQAHSFTVEQLQELAAAAPVFALAVVQAHERQSFAHRLRVFSRRATPSLLGEHPSLQRVRGLIAKAAHTPTTVLITGETGSGKELVARALHNESPRRDKPFLALNCGAIVEHLLESELFGHERGAFTGATEARSGFLELAQGGTLFLDEIGELPLLLQVKLLRALEERSFYRLGGAKPVRATFRLVAATHKNLREEVQQGRFREDLFFRLAVLEIEMPPLRARREDIPLLAEGLLARLSADMGRPAPTLSKAALKQLSSYSWPGNVRELRNVLERALVLCEDKELSPCDLPEDLQAPSAVQHAGSLQEQVAALEQRCILNAMRECAGKKAPAARALGISRPTLDKKLKDYGIDPLADEP